MSRYRAWRFLLPDLDATDEEAGLALSPTGAVSMVADEASVRQAVLLLLSTLPGERVMRPGYGCDLHRLVFEPLDGTTEGLAVHYVRQALERWEPRITILRLDAERNPSVPGRLDVVLEYRVRATLEAGRLTYPLQLTGEPT